MTVMRKFFQAVFVTVFLSIFLISISYLAGGLGTLLIIAFSPWFLFAGLLASCLISVAPSEKNFAKHHKPLSPGQDSPWNKLP
jgi:pheromone shutdown protein TraB